MLDVNENVCCADLNGQCAQTDTLMLACIVSQLNALGEKLEQLLSCILQYKLQILQQRQQGRRSLISTRRVFK